MEFPIRPMDLVYNLSNGQVSMQVVGQIQIALLLQWEMNFLGASENDFGASSSELQFKFVFCAP